MLLESKHWFVLCLAMALAACGSEGTGEGDAGDTSETTEAVGDTTATETTDTDSTGDESENDTGTSDAGTQTDDESTSDAGTQTDDESTSDAGTQTDDESTDTEETTDDTTPDDTTDTDTETGTDTDTDTDEEVAGHDLNGKWEGSYTCSQGFTRLTLQVAHNLESHWLDAVFAFYADNTNPDVPTGRYSMVGSYDPDTQRVILDQATWIEQPTGYVMVSLDGYINEEGGLITGTVDNSGCSEFTVVRGP